MKKIILVLLIMVLASFALGCSESTAPEQTKPANPAASTPAATPAPIQDATITILNSKLTKENTAWIVEGSAQAGQDLSYAQVDVKFYGKDGAVMQSGIANINNLKAGEKWNFKVYGPFEGTVANYTIESKNNF